MVKLVPSDEQIASLLNVAAEKLEKKNGSVFFPNFNFENAPNEITIYHQVRLACEKIRGDVSENGGNDVTYRDLAALVQYISEIVDW